MQSLFEKFICRNIQRNLKSKCYNSVYSFFLSISIYLFIYKYITLLSFSLSLPLKTFYFHIFFYYHSSSCTPILFSAKFPICVNNQHFRHFCCFWHTNPPDRHRCYIVLAHVQHLTCTRFSVSRDNYFPKCFHV